MPRYHITLPGAIPDELFDNLDGDVHNGIRRRLDYAYSGIAKDTYSEDSTPLAALSNLFMRELRDNPLSAKSLIKMFRPVLEDYVAQAQARQPQDFGEIRQRVNPHQNNAPQNNNPQRPQNSQPLEQRAEQGELSLFGNQVQ